MRPTKEQLAEWRAKTEAATDGPCRFGGSDQTYLKQVKQTGGLPWVIKLDPDSLMMTTRDNTDFIETTFEAMPILLDENDQLREEVARLRAGIEKAVNGISDCMADHSAAYDVCCCLNGADSDLKALIQLPKAQVRR